MNLDGLIAFGSGLLSFFAPCVLPLVPSYLIFISGASMDPQGESASTRFNKIVFAHALVFVLGFSFVFVLLGASSSILGRFLSAYQLYIMKLGGILLIVMGLFSLDIIKIPLLNQEKVIHLKEKPLGFFGSFMVGVTFSLGWTPCIGPALSSILILASTEESVGRGVYLLSMYSMGLGLPFIISALLFRRLFGLLRRYGYVVKYTSKVMGALLIVLGLLLVTSYFNRVVQWVEQLF
jgi:cytochrome c-type biogenesis protein